MPTPTSTRPRCRCRTAPPARADSNSDRPASVASPMPIDRLQKAEIGRHIDGRDAGGRIQPEADRRAGERGKPERVAERVGDERGEQHPRRTAIDLPQVAQRQHIVGAQQPVARGGEAQRREHVAPREWRADARRHCGCAAAPARDAERTTTPPNTSSAASGPTQRRPRSVPISRKSPRCRGRLTAARPSAGERLVLDAVRLHGLLALAALVVLACTPGSCLRTRPPASRPRRRGCGWRCGRGTSDRARSRPRSPGNSSSASSSARSVSMSRSLVGSSSSSTLPPDFSTLARCTRLRSPPESSPISCCCCVPLKLKRPT